MEEKRGGIGEGVETQSARGQGALAAAARHATSARDLENAKLVMNNVCGSRMIFSATAVCSSGGVAKTSEVK